MISPCVFCCANLLMRTIRNCKGGVGKFYASSYLTRAAGSPQRRHSLSRPDGGVVTQRTANPLPRPENRQSSLLSRFVRTASFQGLRRSSANSYPGPNNGRKNVDER